MRTAGKFQLLSCFILLFGTLAMESKGSAEVTRLAFGSCLQQNKPKPILLTIAGKKPDAFIFLGDNIYGDTDRMSVMTRKYAELGASEEYKKLKATCPIFAVWDDHDYGVNDGGREVSFKAKSQAVFCDFFEIPQTSRRHREPGNYDAVMLGDADKRIQLLLLDTRSFRSPMKKNPKGRVGRKGPYLPTDDAEQAILGEAQWTWLETQLKKPADIRIVASSIQFLSDRHGWECWGTHPKEEQRFLALIKKTKANGVIFISGDRHRGEISGLNDPEIGYPLIDITASSLNKPSSWDHVEDNPRRLAHKSGPTLSVNPAIAPYNKVHFGMIDINWGAKNSESKAQLDVGLYDIEGKNIWLWQGPLK